MHSFPSYSHSPCFSFNKLFLCFLLSLTLSASLFISSLFLSSSLSTLLTVFFLLLILFHPAISLSISILVSFPAPAEALCLCQILAWVACFHMEVFRRWYTTYVTPVRWLGTLWRSHRVITVARTPALQCKGGERRTDIIRLTKGERAKKEEKNKKWCWVHRVLKLNACLAVCSGHLDG